MKVLVLCGSLIPVSLVVGSSNETVEAEELTGKAARSVQPDLLYTDVGCGVAWTWSVMPRPIGSVRHAQTEHGLIDMELKVRAYAIRR